MPTKTKQTSSKPQKAGYTWVTDRRAKGGGYWRKLRAGFKAGGLASKLIAGAVVAGGAAAAAQAMRKKTKVVQPVAPPEVPPDLNGTAEAEADAKALQKKKNRNTAIALGLNGAAVGAMIAIDVAAARKEAKEQEKAGYKQQGYRQAAQGFRDFSEKYGDPDFKEERGSYYDPENRDPSWERGKRSTSGNRSSSRSSASEPTQSWHETLGVDPGASAADVKRAYREAAKKYHPDINKSPEAEQRMKDLNNAYEKAKRRRRDSLHWENINAAYREAWKAYPSVNVRFWVTNL